MIEVNRMLGSSDVQRGALLLLILLAACRSSSSSRPEQGDIFVPKMTTDAAPSSTPDAAANIIGGQPLGWLLDKEEQLRPQYVDRALVLAALKKSARRAVAVMDEKIEECSGMGGSHVLLKVGSALVHFGGHGTMLQSSFAKGEVYVIAYDALASAESIENKGWCVPARSINGRATALLQVADEAEGNRVLADLAK